MNYKWNYQPPTLEQREAARALSREIGISPILCHLLRERGITTAAEAKRFFRPQLSELHDPFLMKDMDIAVERLNLAMGRKERIMVYGDYDVDGTTAVALVFKFLQQFYSNIDYYIPDRYNEGYGVSKKGVDYAYETGVKLVIVLDCGIKAVEEIAYAKEKGIDFIICDHHVPDEVLPAAAAILNPKREDSTYPYHHLSGCGVGFKFMQAFAQSNGMSGCGVGFKFMQAFAQSNGIEFHQLTPLLDLVAVSIASDIVPIMGENRILAYHGLRQLNTNPSIGLKAIIDVCGLSEREITMSDIVFKIGPRINASGRIQNGKEAVDLLIEKDFKSALEKSNRINRYNETRKDLDKSMTEEANTRRFEEYVTEHILPEQTNATIDIDAQLDFRDITPKFFFDLKKFNPFGPDNHKPIFATLNVYDYGTSKVVGREQEHIKLELVDNKSNNVMNGIAFGQSSQARYIKTKQSFNICYTIEENTHKRGDIQLQIEDIKPSRH